MTRQEAEEKARELIDGWDSHPVCVISDLIPLITDLLLAVQRDVGAKWIHATSHAETCVFVRSPKAVCSCGAHAEQAELHREWAALARKA